MFHICCFWGAGLLADDGEGGPVLQFSGFLRGVSLSGAILVLRCGVGWFSPCECLVDFAQRLFPVAL